jgi:DHA1 family multidrug resistance protein-like MFS transporter
MQLIFSPVWGSVSDRLGRKPVLIIGILGNGLSMLFFGLATQLWMLFAARILSGILSSATLPTTMAYISDSTSEEDRGDGIGKLGAAMGLGVILGPGLGGWLAGSSLALPFFITAGLSLVSALLIAVLLPESLRPVERQQPEARVSVLQLNTLRQALFSPIGVLLGLAFLISFGLTNFEGIFGLYALEKFSYGPERVGTILVMMGIVGTVAQGAVTGRLTRRWGEVLIIRVSMLASAIAFVTMLLADTYFTLLLTIGFFVFTNSLLRPAATALLSKQSDTVGQGVSMGINNSFSSLGRIVGPIWAGLLFDINYDLPYISGALILFVGFVISLLWLSHIERPYQIEGTFP